MEKDNNTSGRRSSAMSRSTSPSPARLCRSKSGSNLASMTTPENSTSSRRFGSSQRFIPTNTTTTTTNNRSKSTSKTRRSYNNNDQLETTNNSISTREYGFGNNNNKLLQRGMISPDNSSVGASKRTTTMKSPSAWALSPGRFLRSPVVSEPPPQKAAKSDNNKSGGSGVSKVFKYFRQKKVCTVQEEEYHKFKILHNRLVQWKFVNARAQAAMANVKKAAQLNLFCVWMRMVVLRKMILEKKMEMQKVKQKMKQYQMVTSQLCLLNEWAKIERKNEEYVRRLGRKLSALSICLPLHDLKGDMVSVYEAMKTALEVMGSINLFIRKYQIQVERILYQVTELSTISKQHEEYFQQLLRIIPNIVSSLENEKSMRVHLMQTIWI